MSVRFGKAIKAFAVVAMMVAASLTVASPAHAQQVNISQCHFTANTPTRSGARINGSARYWCNNSQNPLNNKRDFHMTLSEWDYYQGWISRAAAHNDAGFATGVTLNAGVNCKFGRWRVVAQAYIHNTLGGYWTPASYSGEYSANC